MKKILAAVLLLVALSTSVLAIANIQYTFNKANVYSEAYNCLDATCATVAAFSGSPQTQTVATGTMTYSFPTVLVGPYNYSVYYVSNGYVPMEYKANWYGTGTASYPKINFYKIANCQADVTLVQIYNAVLPNNSIVVQSAVGLNGATSSPFRLNNSLTLPAYVPPTLRDYYSADVVVTLRVTNASGAQVYQQALALTGANALFADEVRPINFTWTPTEEGDFTATLTAHVTDNQCSSVVDTTDDDDFTVSMPLPPVITPVPDQFIQEDVGGSVDVTAVDPNGDPVSFYVSVQNPAQVTCSFAANTLIMTPAADYNGPATCTIVATDGALDSAPVIVNITVTPVNDAPTMDAVPDQTVFEDLANTVDVAPYAHDIDGNPLTFSVVAQNPAQVGCSFAGSVLTMQATEYIGPATCSIRANDGFANSNTVIVNITVLFRNDPPVLGALPNQQILEDSTGNSLDIVQFATDEENDSMTAVVLAQNPAQVACAAVGRNVTMTPAADWFGNATCTVAVTDGNQSNSQTLNIEVLNVNDAPVLLAIPDQSVDEDSSNTTDLAAYASDIDGDTLTWNVVANGPSMTCFFVGSVLNFTPDPLFNGLTSCTINVTDPSGASSVNQVVTIDVRHVNHAPIARNDSLLTDEDVTGSTNVLANDSDVDVGDVISISGWTDGANGNVTCAGTDCFYTPAADFNGADSFTYTITDGIATATATVDVTVGPVNDAPVLAAIPDQSVDEDSSNTTDIAPYASDVDGDTLTYNVVANGPSMTCFFVGSVLNFTPDLLFHGLTSCTINVTDPSGASSVNQVVTIDVRHVNHAPVALDDSLVTDEDVTGSTNVLANDSDVDVGDIISISGWTDGANGNVTCAGTDCWYTPAADFNGADTFTYTITDGIASDTATVFVTVGPVNDAPVLAAIPDQSVDEDSSNTTDIAPYASDVDGDTLTYNVVANGPSMTCFFVGSVLNFTPDLLFHGLTSCTVNVTDPSGASSVNQVVTIDVRHVNHLPIALDDSLVTDEDTTGSTNVLANDSDPDVGDVLTISGWTDGLHGNVSCAGTDCFYTPAPDFNGLDNFTYSITDGTALATATVFVTVGPVNDAPVLNPIANVSILEDGSGVFNLSGSASDVDGDTLTYNVVTDGVNVHCFFDGDTLNVTAITPDYFGPDSCTVNVTDPSAASSVNQVVTIDVLPVNDAPSYTASGDITVAEDSGPYSAAWASAMSVGPANEAGQLLFFIVSDNNTVLFSAQPTIDATTGVLDFTPAANMSGVATVTVLLQDDGGTDNGGVNTTLPFTFTITVTPVNDAPTLAAIPDQHIMQDTTTDANLSAYAFDVDGDALTWNVVAMGLNMTCAFNGDNLTMTPDIGFIGNTSCTVNVTDPSLASSENQVVNIEVLPLHQVIANDDSVSTNEDTAVTFDPRLNDVDTFGHDLSIIQITQGSHGAVLSNGTHLTYTPAADYNGADNFTYMISDGTLNDTAEVFVTVNPVNDDPVLNPIANVSILEDGSGIFNLSAYASDVDGDALTYNVVTDGVNVACFFDGDTLNVTAVTPDYFGPDSCTVNVTDGNGGSSVNRVVTIDVLPVNDAPSYNAGGDVTVAEDSGLYNLAWASGMSPGPLNEAGQTLFFILNNSNNALFSGQPVVDATTGNLSFTPAADANGLATVTVVLQDNGGTANGGINTTAPITFTITVTPVNDAPVLTQPANLTILEDQTGSLNISGNASDVDGDALTYNIVASGVNLTCSFVGDNLTVTPDLDYFGTSSCTINVTDPSLESSVNRVVTVTVTPVNDAPSYTASGDVTVAEDSGLYNASWASGMSVGPLNEAGQTLFFIVGNNNSVLFSGQPSIDSTTGLLTFTPAANAFGSALVSVRLEDNGGTANGGVNATGTTTFVITVTSVNDAPVLTALSNMTIIEDQTGSLNISGNASDVDGDSLTYNIVANGVNVGCSFVGSNLTVVPNADWFGVDSCTVNVTDPSGASSVNRVVTITVTPVNDAPVLAAIPDQSFPEDTPTSVNLSSYVSDVDDSVHTFHTVANGANIVCAFAGDIMTMTPTADWFGSTTCTINVTDPSGASSVNRVVNITVTPVNDAPIVVTQPANITIAQNSSIVIDLSPYFSDVDNATLVYGYGFSGTNMTFSLVGSLLNITPTGPEFFGDQPGVINFTASDGSLTAVTVNVGINVTQNPVVGDNIVVNGTLFGTPGVTRTDTTAYFQGTYNVFITGASWLYNSDIDNAANTNINASHMWGTIVRNSWIIDSLNITNSNVTNSWLTNCVVINSTVKNIVASDCDFRDSLVDPPSGLNDLTGSTVFDHSTILHSNVTYSTVDNSSITDSFIDHSTIIRSVLDDTNMSGSTVTDSTGTGSTITDSTVQNGSTVTNSSVTDGSTVTNSTVFDGSHIGHSTVNGSSVGNSNVTDSTITLSTLGNSTVTGSTITNSTLQNDTVDDSRITNCYITNSTIDDSRLRNCNRPLTNVNITNGTIDDGQFCNGTITWNGRTTTLNNSCTNITDLVNYGPTASFTLPVEGHVGTPVQFHDTSTDPNIPGPLGDHLSYSWSFGHSGTSTAQNPAFTFTAVGHYTVYLNVTDAFGLKSNVSHTIDILPRSGGGGGGGGSDDILITPKTYDIDVGGMGSVCRRVVFNDILRFTLLGGTQTVRVTQIGTNFISLNVSGQNKDVVQGITGRVDLNGDATYDLAISLENVTYPYATICLESVSIPIVPPVNATNVTTPRVPPKEPTGQKTGSVNVTLPTGAVNATAPAGNATGNESAAGTGWHWPSWKLPAIPGSWLGWFVLVGIVLFGLLIYGLIRFGVQRMY